MTRLFHKVFHRNAHRDAWSWVAVPGVVFMLAGFGSALAFCLFRSLTDPDPSNYLALLSGSPARAFVSTFRAAAMVTVVVLAMGYTYAFAMHVGPRVLRYYLIVFLAIQFATSSVARAYSWVQLLQTHGVINKALLGLGIIDKPLKLMRNDLGMVIGTSHVLLPYMVIILYASMRNVDLRTLSAARSLGASPTATFLQVYLPSTRVGVIFGSGLIFIMALTFYTTPALLGATTRPMISDVIMNSAAVYGDFGLASALSISLVGTTLIILALVSVLLRRFNRAGDATI